MFTGMIQRVGKLHTVERQGETGRIAIYLDQPFDKPVHLGGSIAVNGACLTVAAMEDRCLIFDVLSETFDRTTLGGKQAGDRVNLEPALALGDPLGGHIVTGHVDGTGMIQNIEKVGRDWKFEFTCSRDILMLLVCKGSVAVDGISLTVAELTDTGFAVHIIPHTCRETAISSCDVGGRVNIETDLFGKHVKRILELGGSWNFASPPPDRR